MSEAQTGSKWRRKLQGVLELPFKSNGAFHASEKTSVVQESIPCHVHTFLAYYYNVSHYWEKIRTAVQLHQKLQYFELKTQRVGCETLD